MTRVINRGRSQAEEARRAAEEAEEARQRAEVIMHVTI